MAERIDRRALVIGSWLEQGRAPSPQKVKAITNRWSKIFGESQRGFRSLTNKRRKPDVFHNPQPSFLASVFENASCQDGAELLLYFLGHSTAFGANDLLLSMGLNEDGEEQHCRLSWLLSTIHQFTPIRKLVAILDTCHAGRTRSTFSTQEFVYLAMLGTGSGYAFDARFSEGVLRALEEPLRKKDQRIDRVAGGMTYEKVFQYARSHVIDRMLLGRQHQSPRSFGDYSGDLLMEAPVVVPDEFNESAQGRTVYGRVYRLLGYFAERRELSPRQLKEVVRSDDIFLLRKDEENGHRYLSNERLNDYVAFLVRTGWIVFKGGRYRVTNSGSAASNRERWNRCLLEVIESEVFSDRMTMEFLDDIVTELLKDMIPATPIRIKERAGMKGLPLRLDAATRVALQVLPSTGRFMKGAADAIFPSERGV